MIKRLENCHGSGWWVSIGQSLFERKLYEVNTIVQSLDFDGNKFSSSVVMSESRGCG